MNFLVFNSLKELELFLKRKLDPKIENGIEYSIMEKFKKFKILFTAEHAVSKKIKMKEFGKNAYAFVGDENTGLFAKLAAYYTRSAYIMPLFSRIEADAARPIEDLGKGLRLFVKISNSEKQNIAAVLIHKNKNYLSNLLKYHEIIEKLRPKAIISIHGMHKSRPFDVVFGFGEDYKGIKNKETAFRFRNEFLSFLDQKANKILKNPIKIGIGTKRFAGKFNPIIKNHIIDYNKKFNDERIGIQVELNWLGRSDDQKPNLNKDYQILIQVLGEFVIKWLNS